MTDSVGPASARGPFAAFLELAPGSRVVVRYRVGELATDVLGLMVRRDDTSCDIRTRRGDVTIAFSDIVAAKPVPPPPAPRIRRPPGEVPFERR